MSTATMIAHPMRHVSIYRRAFKVSTARELCSVLDDCAELQPDHIAPVSVVTAAGAGLVLAFWFFDWLRPVLASDGQERTGE